MYINKPKTMEHHEGTGCRTLEGPILCINNCGFFGSATTMNMCSKCHKDYVLKQEQAQLAASSIDSIVNGSGAASEKEAVTINSIDLNVTPVEAKTISTETVTSNAAVASESSEPKSKGPTRCTSCKKKVGLTGFSCRCGHIFCTAHRYADQHDCSYDFQSAGRDAIAKANPLIKADKLDNKI